VPGSCGEAPAYFPAIPLASLHSLGRDLPVDSGKKVFLAKVVFERLRSEKEFLLWLHDWVVWPSSGHVPLILRLRESPGESRGLEDAPGILITREEIDDGISILILALQFYWDCLVVGASGSLAFFTSHDEFCSFMSTDEASLEGLMDPLGPAGGPEGDRS
jgi:hypothetical protein